MLSAQELNQLTQQTFAGATYGVFINNQWQGADRTFPVENPATKSSSPYPMPVRRRLLRPSTPPMPPCLLGPPCPPSNALT